MRAAVIPAFRPGPALTGVVEGCRDMGMTVVVVDDGSGPDYAHVFQEVQGMAEVLGYPLNHGKGYALKQAFTHLERIISPDDVVVTLDCDGQHTALDAARVCRDSESHPGAFVLGSRAQDSSSPLRSRMGNAFMRGMFKLVSGVSVNDTQTGLRAFPARYLRQMLGVRGEHYEYETNVLLHCAAVGIPIREIAVSTIYTDGNAGSHYATFRDSARIARVLLAGACMGGRR